MALGSTFAVMAILMAETLITLGASLQRWCQGQEAWVAFSDAKRQPMSSGATCSAGRQKKDWGRRWEGVVAMGVAREAQPH